MNRRTRKCAVKTCRTVFAPMNMMHKACSPDCAQVLAVQQREKVERKADQVKRETLKSSKDLKHEAQAAFNAFIRARDEGMPCICCGQPFEPMKPGGSIDAGHYLSVGAAVHLRFDERNVHAQRKNCNRPGGTTRAKFRSGMIARVGLEVVETLEADQSAKNYRAEDYRDIRDKYRAKLKELKSRHKLNLDPADMAAGVARYRAQEVEA